MPAANGWDWRHTLYTAFGASSALVEALSTDQGHSVALAMHLSAGTLFVAAMVMGYISRSLSLPAKPPVVVAVSDTPGMPARNIPSTVVTP